MGLSAVEDALTRLMVTILLVNPNRARTEITWRSNISVKTVLRLEVQESLRLQASVLPYLGRMPFCPEQAKIEAMSCHLCDYLPLVEVFPPRRASV